MKYYFQYESPNPHGQTEQIFAHVARSQDSELAHDFVTSSIDRKLGKL